MPPTDVCHPCNQARVGRNAAVSIEPPLFRRDYVFTGDESASRSCRWKSFVSVESPLDTFSDAPALARSGKQGALTWKDFIQR